MKRKETNVVSFVEIEKSTHRGLIEVSMHPSSQ